MIQMPNTYQELSTTIREVRHAILSPAIPDLPFPELRHSHSMVLDDDNALIFQRKFFLRIPKNRIPDPSKNRALEFKGEFRRFAICSISTTIGINRSIFSKLSQARSHKASSKKDRQP